MFVEENRKGYVSDGASAHDTSLERSRFDDETFADRDAFAKTLSPVIKLMKLTGSYFESCKVNNDRQTEKKLAECKRSWNFGEKYSMALTFLLWLNTVRFLTAFIAAENKFDEALVNKLVMVAFFSQNAFIKTTFFFASRNGRLDQALHQLRITNDFIQVARKVVGIRILVYSTTIAMYMTFFLYALFFTDDSFNFLLTPFVTLIPINDVGLKVAKSIFISVNALSLQSFLWPMTLYQTLADVLTRQFRILNNRFRIANSRRRRFKSSIKTMRHRHQALCFAVRTVDSCLTFAPAAIFCSEMFIIIVLLYGFMFLNYTNPAVIAVYTATLTLSVVSLSINVVNGTKLNSAVGIFQCISRPTAYSL